jgi:outer membrane protein OmpA-like peptidoglycan-associated protein
MKNPNRLFGRKLSKLILTPIISFGLVAGFAVTPARANFDPNSAPYAGEIEIERTDVNEFDWNTWIDNVADYYSPGDRETFFDKSVDFAVVACTASSVSIDDCIGGSEGNEVNGPEFVGIMKEHPGSPSQYLKTTTGSPRTTRIESAPSDSASGTHVRSIEIDRNGTTSPLPFKWHSDALGFFGSDVVLGTTVAYKVYIFMWVSGFRDPNGTAGVAPYYASAPISVDFRPLSATPTISTQPVGASKTVGDSLSLTVSGSGAGTLSYQWKKDGSNLAGKTSATLSIPSVATSDAGSYTVDVTNQETGYAPVTVTSNAAVVSVTAATSAPATTTAGSTLNTKTAKAGAIAFSAGTSAVSSATKKKIKATVKKAGKSAKFTITGSAGQLPGISDKAVKALAKKRANVLKAYLVKLGVPKSSITIKTKVVKQGKKPKASVLALY